MLDDIAAATQELAGMRDRLAGRLVVAGFPAATAALLPRAIARLTAAHPGLKVQLTEAPTPAQLAAFINLRVLNPEHQHWRRGIEAATLFQRLHGDLKVPFTYRVPAKDVPKKK